MFRATVLRVRAPPPPTMSLQEAPAITDPVASRAFDIEKTTAEIEEVELQIDDIEYKLAAFYPKTRFKNNRIGWARRLKNHPCSQPTNGSKIVPDDFKMMTRLLELYKRRETLTDFLVTMPVRRSREEIRRALKTIPVQKVSRTKAHHIEVAERRKKYRERRRQQSKARQSKAQQSKAQRQQRERVLDDDDEEEEETFVIGEVEEDDDEDGANQLVPPMRDLRVEQ